MKQCKTCGTEKALSEFYVRSETGATRTECKSCVIDRQRYKKLGVCNADYVGMLMRQKGCCAVCDSMLDSSRYTKLAVDHDHKTGKVRGLLCTNCNTALGLMKDSPERLARAAAYLNKHRVEEIVSSRG